MRRTVLPSALAFLLTLVGTAHAGGGLPVVATLEAGSYHATLYNDSPEIQQGANTLTLEIHGMVPDATATLRLIGPSGQGRVVHLEPLVGTAAGHGDSHAAPTDSHGDSHGAPATAGPAYTARGKVSLDTTGTWTVALEVQTPDGPLHATAPVTVVYGGPSPIFVGAAGLLMGGTITYGAIQRRRQTPGRR